MSHARSNTSTSTSSTSTSNIQAFTREFELRALQARALAFIDVVHEHPEMTLQDVMDESARLKLSVPIGRLFNTDKKMSKESGPKKRLKVHVHNVSVDSIWTDVGKRGNVEDPREGIVTAIQGNYAQVQWSNKDGVVAVKLSRFGKHYKRIG